MGKFKKGQVYDRVSWFTGGEQLYEVTGVCAGKVFFSVTAYELDGIHKRNEQFELKQGPQGQYVVLFSYKGEECAIHAKQEEKEVA